MLLNPGPTRESKPTGAFAPRRTENSLRRSRSLSSLDALKFDSPRTVLSTFGCFLAADFRYADPLWAETSSVGQWTSRQKHEAFLKVPSAADQPNEILLQVQFDCFGYPLFDLQADSPPPLSPMSSKVPITLLKPSASDSPHSMSLLDFEKAARRARRRRSKNASKNDSTHGSGLIPPTSLVPPLRRRRSTGFLTSIPRCRKGGGTSNEPFANWSAEPDSKHGKGEGKPRRRRSLGGGGMLDASISSYNGMPYSVRSLRTSSHSPQSMHKGTSQGHRRPRRTLSDRGLGDFSNEDSNTFHGKTSSSPKTQPRRRCGSKRRSLTSSTTFPNMQDLSPVSVSKTPGKERRSSGSRSSTKPRVPSHHQLAELHKEQTPQRPERRQSRRMEVNVSQCLGTPERMTASVRNPAADASARLLVKQRKSDGVRCSLLRTA
jgi:hypothetical protein